MSWHSPFLNRPVSPWKGIHKANLFATELESAGIATGTEEWTAAVNQYLGREVDERCRCGRRLRLFESGAEVCYPCSEAAEAAKGAAEDSPEGRMKKIGVPPCYHHCTFATFRGQVPVSVDEWILRPKSSLVFFGASPGTGKTHLATAALYSMRNGGRRCFWASAVVLAKRLSEETYSTQETQSRSVKVETLLVDDLGREDGVVPRAKEMIAALLDERYQYNRPTIVTTNLVHLDADGELVVDKLVAYDTRLASRLLSGTLVAREGVDERWR